jgi:hypothetical protein
MSTPLRFVDSPVRFDVVSDERRFVASLAQAYPDLAQFVGYFRRHPLVALTEDDVTAIARNVRPEWFAAERKEHAVPKEITLTMTECQQRIDDRVAWLTEHPFPIRPHETNYRAELDARCAADDELRALHRAMRHPTPRPAPRLTRFHEDVEGSVSADARTLLEATDDYLRISRPHRFSDAAERRSAARYVADALKLSITDRDIEAVATGVVRIGG